MKSRFPKEIEKFYDDALMYHVRDGYPEDIDWCRSGHHVHEGVIYLVVLTPSDRIHIYHRGTGREIKEMKGSSRLGKIGLIMLRPKSKPMAISEAPPEWQEAFGQGNLSRERRAEQARLKRELLESTPASATQSPT